jgi:hypothetical protein
LWYAEYSRRRCAGDCSALEQVQTPANAGYGELRQASVVWRHMPCNTCASERQGALWPSVLLFSCNFEFFCFLHHCVSLSFLERILCRLIFNLLLGFCIGLCCAACLVTHALQHHNQVDDQGAAALADSLKTNSCLRTLNLVSEGCRGRGRGGGG